MNDARARDPSGPAPAGPGSRCYAFAIDWHIRALAALAWMLGAVLVSHPPLRLEARATLVVLLPAAALYFLYHPVLEMISRGQSPGKRIVGLRVVDRAGGAPGRRRILIRNALRLIDSLPIFYAVGLVSCFVTADGVRLGDLAAGTVLVHAAAVPAADGEEAREIALRLLERWGSIDPGRRREFARALLERLGTGAAGRLTAETGDDELRSRLRASCTRG